MKLSKQELKQKISDSIKDNDDLVISLLEDIEDSMIENNEQVIDETNKKELPNQDLYNRIEEKIKEKIGSKVKIQRKTGEKGKIEIEYYSTEDLERIMEILM